MFRKFLICLLPLATLGSCNKSQEPLSNIPLYITNLSNDVTIQYDFDSDDKERTPNLQYSFDRKKWETLNIVQEVTTTIATLSKNQTIYFRGDNPNFFCYYSWDWPHTNYDTIAFSFCLANHSADTKLKIGGNIMSLLSTDNYANKIDIPCNGCFHGLFFGFGQMDENDVQTNGYPDIDASELLLPATELTSYAYYDMFDYSLISKAPLNLPAVNAAKGMYEDMFSCCENLVTAPTINLNNLLESSCNCMFDGCSKLDISKKNGRVKIFTCPADVSAYNCVSSMFGETKQEINDPQPGEVFYYN